MEEAVALLAAEKCTNAAVAAAAGTAAAVPHEPAAAAVTAVGNRGAFGPVLVAACVADRAKVATVDAAESVMATAAVAVAVAQTNTNPETGGFSPEGTRGYAAGCAMRSHSWTSLFQL